MILKTYPNKNLYGKYFLATEAPDDETVTEDQAKPKRNVKVISVKPSNRGKDFTQVGNPPITADDTDVNDEVDLDTTDYSTDTAEEETPTQPEEPTTSEETTPPVEEVPEQPTQEGDADQDTQVEQPDTGDDDNTDFTSDTGDIPTEGDETGEDGPDTGGDEDFTAGSDDQSMDDTTQDNQDNANAATDKPAAPGVELDSTRKYNLYKEYMSLYNACDNYIGKLENILKDDTDENKIIRISVNNLREIKDILYDYMTIRFQLNTYVQSLLFYQKMVVAVQLVFNLLKSIKTLKTTK